MNRTPFRKSIPQIPIEEAHGGSGSRQLLLSPSDPISPNLQAMTKGFLPMGSDWDWHSHEGIDEWFIVLKGTCKILYRNGTSMICSTDDLVYIPANTEHRIENTSQGTTEFYFVRIMS